MPPSQASEALLKGRIDAAGILSSWDSAEIHRLLASSGVDIIGFPRADAYTALYPYLTKLRLPRGVGNMADNRPPTDVDLIAAQAYLDCTGRSECGHSVPVASGRDGNPFAAEPLSAGRISSRTPSEAMCLYPQRHAIFIEPEGLPLAALLTFLRLASWCTESCWC